VECAVHAAAVSNATVLVSVCARRIASVKRATATAAADRAVTAREQMCACKECARAKSIVWERFAAATAVLEHAVLAQAEGLAAAGSACAHPLAQANRAAATDAAELAVTAAERIFALSEIVSIPPTAHQQLAISAAIMAAAARAVIALHRSRVMLRFPVFACASPIAQARRAATTDAAGVAVTALRRTLATW
jgi:hypothetical protein